MSVVWLTYDELAERLGIERESARQHVKRKHWARQRGNDEEVLSARTETGTEGDTEPVQTLVQPPVPEPGVTAVLTRHIERLEAQLEEALKRAGDRDEVAKQRDMMAAQIEALNDSTKIQVDALRAALTAAERDRDRWHVVATAKPEQTVLAERKPWWRRLAG
jgi:hypothetical protein